MLQRGHSSTGFEDFSPRLTASRMPKNPPQKRPNRTVTPTFREAFILVARAFHDAAIGFFATGACCDLHLECRLEYRCRSH